jgi:serine/threonine protein phosphatase PrpC
MQAAYAGARRAVVETAFKPAPDLGAPSCTYLAAVITSDRVTISSLGDCRAYWLGDDGARQLTRDHSWAGEQIEAGALPAGDAYADSRAHMITRWLGQDADPAWQPDTITFSPPGAGRILLCSDGLWNYAVTADAIAHVAGQRPEPLALARHLVDFANEAGGADNITVVVVNVPVAHVELGRRAIER